MQKLILSIEKEEYIVTNLLNRHDRILSHLRRERRKRLDLEAKLLDMEKLLNKQPTERDSEKKTSENQSL